MKVRNNIKFNNWCGGKFSKIPKFFLVGTLFLALPVSAATIYQRTPNRGSIDSPVSFTISMDEYIGTGHDSGCNLGTATKAYYQGTPYWGLAFLNKDRSDFIAISNELVPSATLSHTFVENLPAGSEIGEVIFICSETPQISFNEWYVTQYTGNDLEVLNAANPITVTTISAPSTSQ